MCQNITKNRDLIGIVVTKYYKNHVKILQINKDDIFFEGNKDDINLSHVFFMYYWQIFVFFI